MSEQYDPQCPTCVWLKANGTDMPHFCGDGFSDGIHRSQIEEPVGLIAPTPPAQDAPHGAQAIAPQRFPNRTWPWRQEDDGDREAEVERATRDEPPFVMSNGRKVYFAPKVKAT